MLGETLLGSTRLLLRSLPTTREIRQFMIMSLLSGLAHGGALRAPKLWAMWPEPTRSLGAKKAPAGRVQDRLDLRYGAVVV